jgi:hypothetical protein
MQLHYTILEYIHRCTNPGSTAVLRSLDIAWISRHPKLSSYTNPANCHYHVVCGIASHGRPKGKLRAEIAKCAVSSPTPSEANRPACRLL